MGRCLVTIDLLACLWTLLTQNICADAMPGATMKSAEEGSLSRKLMNAASSPEPPPSAPAGAGDAGSSIVQVATALEFVDAIAAETAHIVVVEHLNLDEVPDENPELTKYLMEGIPASVLSITGQCADPPSIDSQTSDRTAPMLEVAPMTCVIRTGIELFKVINGRLWLSQLYLRLNRRSNSGPVISVRSPGELWMSQMTVQGDGAMQGWTALTTFDAGKLLVDESVFSHIGGRIDGVSLGFGTSSFISTSFEDSPVSNADKALLRLYDDHVMKLEVVDISSSSESAGSPISTFTDPVKSVFADAMTSTGLEILDRSSGSVGRAGVLSRAQGDFLAKHDQWLVDVKQERDSQLAAITEAQVPENPATTETLPGTIETTPNIEGSNSDSINLTVVVCIAVAGMCVLVAAVLAFLLLSGRGRGEPEVDPVKGGQSVMCDSNFMDADSKATSITDAMSSHHNNRMFRMHNSTPFDASSTGYRIPSSTLANSNNHNGTLSAGGSQGSGQPLPPGTGSKAAATTSGGGWYWPTLAQELDALSDTRDTTSQQDINNTALTGNSLYTRTKGSTNGGSRPGGVIGATLPSPRINAVGPNMLMHPSTGAGPPGGIPIAGTGDGFSNVFSGGVVSMAQSHHLGNTIAMSTAQLGTVGRPAGVGPGPTDDSAAHYIRIEVDRSDDEQAASQERPDGARDSSTAQSPRATSDTKLANDAGTASVAVSSTGGVDAPEANGRAAAPPQQTDADLRNAPDTSEPAQSTPPAAAARGMERLSEINAESSQSRSDAVAATHSPRPSPGSHQESSRTAGVYNSGSTAHSRRRSFHQHHSGQTQLTQFTCSTELDGSQAGMSSTALMDTSRLVGPVVGKLLSSPPAPRHQDHESSVDRFGRHAGTRSNTSTSNNLNPPDILPDPAMLINSNCVSNQSIVGNTATSTRGKRSRKALSSAAEAKSDTYSGGYAGVNGSAFHNNRTAEPMTMQAPDSPHSKTVSLSRGMSSRMEGDSVAPTSTSFVGSETTSRHLQPAGYSARGKVVRKPSTRNGRSTLQTGAQDERTHLRADRSISIESPTSTSYALNGVSVHHDQPAVLTKSYSLLNHSEILSDQSHSGSHTASNMLRSGVESTLVGRGNNQSDTPGSPRPALSQGSTAQTSGGLAPGAATRELHKLDALAEHSETGISEMDGSDMAGIGMPVRHPLKHAAIPEEHNMALSGIPDGAQASQQLAVMYASASGIPSQLPDGNSRSKNVAYSGYMPDGDSENVFSTFGNTGVNMPHALHEYHNLQEPVPEDGSVGYTSSMSGISGGVMRPAVRLPAVAGGRRGGVTSVPPCKPQPVAVMQSLSSFGEQSDMGLMAQHSEDTLADIPGGCDSTGLLSSELEIAPPKATSRPRVS